MMEQEQEKLTEILEYLSQNVHPRKFGLRNGYILSHVFKKVRFDLFLRVDSISLKYPSPNINEEKIIFLSKLVEYVNPNFKYNPYTPMKKNTYSRWELDTKKMSYKEISKILLEIETKDFL